jgi:hypothetical protein
LLLRPVAVWARAWQAALLLRGAGLGLGVRDVWRAFMFGELLSRFVPANLGTVAYVAKLSQRASVAVIAQFLDRVFFLLLTLLVAVLTLLAAGHGLFALVASGALLGVLLLTIGLYRGALHWAPLGQGHREAIESVLRGRKEWGPPYVLASSSSLALTAVLFELLVAACGGTVHVFEGLAAVALVTIGVAVPLTVNGIGIREWVFVVLLKETLPSNEAVVTLAGVTYLVGFASALIGVAAWALSGQKVQSGDAKR